MPPPVQKRRKLSHRADEEDSEDSSSAFSLDDNLTTQESSASTVEDQNLAVEAASPIEDDIAEEISKTASTFGSTENVEEDAARSPGAAAPSSADIARTLPNGVRRAKDYQPRHADNAAYTGGIYKSNMFKMQTDELLHEVRLKDGKKEALAEQALRQLKTVIEGIPDRDQISVGCMVLKWWQLLRI